MPDPDLKKTILSILTYPSYPIIIETDLRLKIMDRTQTYLEPQALKEALNELVSDGFLEKSQNGMFVWKSVIS